VLVLPLVYRGERMGEMRVSPRTPGEPYGPGRPGAARRARQPDLRSGLRPASRHRVAGDPGTSPGDGRRGTRAARARPARWHRPLLAGAGLTAEALLQGNDSGHSRRAGCRAARLPPADAATELRRLAHDLQPTPLQDRGLGSALADYIATLDAPEMPHIRLRAAVAGSLPAAVEQGAYLVVLEALNNVVRHANAEQSEVTGDSRAQ